MWKEKGGLTNTTNLPIGEQIWITKNNNNDNEKREKNILLCFVSFRMALDVQNKLRLF